MYESIRGTLKDKAPNQAIVECGGIAYRLTIPLSSYTRLPACETVVSLFLSQVIREDAHTLFAFLQKEDRDLFETLLSISGIGPKTAAGIIGHMEVNAFQRAISTADIRLLSKLPGIGKKTAERLIIEMRDKFKGKNKTIGTPVMTGGVGDLASDAINALVHLGYSAMDAQQAIQEVMNTQKEETDLGRLITAALRRI
jgi:Holliday junction DNA helicase RuvA